MAFREWDVVDRVILDQRILPGHLGHMHELEFVCSYLCMKPNRGDSGSPLRCRPYYGIPNISQD
ncbi:hypothetical protein EMIT093MI4_10219 [Pseudomonas sp. IT-93MI4]